MRQINKRPYVTLKLAVSADGMLGRPGEEVAITGAAARSEVHRIRAESDGILVGIGTVLADDPELTVRLTGLEERSPVRIILDRGLRLPLDSRLVKSARVVPVIAVADKGAEDRRAALVDVGVEILEVDTLDDLLIQLAQRGISNLMVEGGATIASAFLKAGLVDRVMLFESDIVIGEGGLESPLTRADMPEDFSLVETADHGPDRCFIYERPF
jgi:diaminohydroxyphosphoribosylaminopyrimidine deaminase/5-amino-6-(5-phosphoribosylamino)uracil reductase